MHCGAPMWPVPLALEYGVRRAYARCAESLGGGGVLLCMCVWMGGGEELRIPFYTTLAHPSPQVPTHVLVVLLLLPVTVSAGLRESSTQLSGLARALIPAGLAFAEAACGAVLEVEDRCAAVAQEVCVCGCCCVSVWGVVLYLCLSVCECMCVRARMCVCVHVCACVNVRMRACLCIVCGGRGVLYLCLGQHRQHVSSDDQECSSGWRGWQEGFVSWIGHKLFYLSVCVCCAGAGHDAAGGGTSRGHRGSVCSPGA